MANRCFEQIHKHVKQSSEYTREKRLKEKWCDLFHMNPYANDSRYAIGIRVNGETSILTAPSQSELLDIVKAKFVANPSLIGADTCINNAQAGNLLTYDGETKQLQFNDQNQFWRCTNSDPLHGFSYPSTVDLVYQAPNTSKNIPKSTDALLDALYGKNKIR